MTFELLWHEILPYDKPVQWLSYAAEVAAVTVAGNSFLLQVRLPSLCCRQGCTVAEALKTGMLVLRTGEVTGYKQPGSFWSGAKVY